jgi:hypothetical protein
MATVLDKVRMRGVGKDEVEGGGGGAAERVAGGQMEGDGPDVLDGSDPRRCLLLPVQVEADWPALYDASPLAAANAARAAELVAAVEKSSGPLAVQSQYAMPFAKQVRRGGRLWTGGRVARTGSWMVGTCSRHLCTCMRSVQGAAHSNGLGRARGGPRGGPIADPQCVAGGAAAHFVVIPLLARPSRPPTPASASSCWTSSTGPTGARPDTTS